VQGSFLNQYVVYRADPQKNRLSWGLVTGENDTDVHGTNEKGLPYSEDQQFDVPKKHVIAVLGTRPHFGTAYGCRVEPFFRTIEHEAWGSIHLFRKMEKEDKLLLRKALGSTHSKLKREGLTGFLPLDLEIRNAKGRYAGMYKFTGKADVRDKMLLHPKVWNDPDQPLPFLIFHEAGHGVWYRLMSVKQKARWIAMYHSYLKISDCDPATVKTLRDDFCGQSGEHASDFRGQLDSEEVAPIFDLCIDHITSYHGLSVRNIDNLIDADDGAVLKAMWPTIKVLKTDYEYPITEYAMTKPEEFFAEAFAFAMVGKLVPKRIAALMSSTLQRVAGRSK
jgi:hypothetical protein